MRRETNGKRNSGFTLVEMLAVTAIVVILLAVGMVSVVRYARWLEITELDNTAREIYLAAENRAVLLSAGGREAARLTGEQVQALLPHRPPMLFIDEVSRLIAGEEAEAVFSAAPGLPAFQGHFPGGPVLPGVYLAEAAAQAAAVALMAGGRYGGKLPLLAGIRRAVFRRRVLPGETLEIYAAVTEERPELGWAACRGRVSVQGELAAELELCLAFR